MKWQIPYNGRDWEFDDQRLTLTEASLQKRLAGGGTPADIEERRLGRDGDAWLAALVIARRRAGLSPEEALDVDGDRFDLMRITTPKREPETEPEAEQPADTATTS